MQFNESRLARHLKSPGIPALWRLKEEEKEGKVIPGAQVEASLGYIRACLTQTDINKEVPETTATSTGQWLFSQHFATGAKDKKSIFIKSGLGRTSAILVPRRPRGQEH